MNLSFSTLGCPEWDVRQIIENACRYQIPAVELRCKDRVHISPSVSKIKRMGIKKMFKKAGVKIAALAAYTKFSQNAPDILAQNEKDLIDALYLAEDLGCPYVRTFTGYFPEGVDEDVVYHYMANSINSVIDKTRKLKAKILIENHDSLVTGEKLKKLLDKIGGEVYVVWDVHHSLVNGEDIQKTLAYIGNYIRHVHIKDAKYDPQKKLWTDTDLGEGDLPIADCVAALCKNGYAGYYSLESEKLWKPYLKPLGEVLPVYYTYMEKILGGIENEIVY